jgi:predicted O-linked N-acetylglucosamine transferase (SPINDLY family)
MSNPAARDYLSRGRALWAAGNAAGALAALDASLAADSGFVDAHVLRSAALTALGRHAEAVAALGQAQRLAPADPDILSHIAAALIAAGQYAQAAAAAEEALRLHPGHAGALVNGATAVRLAGDAPAAAVLLERAVAAHPGMLEAWYGYGQVLAALGRWPQAVAAFERAAAIAPQRLEPRRELVKAYFGDGRFADAVTAADLLLRANPPAALQGEVLITAAAALQRLGRLPEALAAVRRATARLPQVADVHFERGVLEGAAGGLAASIPHYQEALRLDAGHPRALANLGDALRSVGRQAEALDCTRHAVAALPQEGRIHSALLYALHYAEGITPGSLLAEHRRWAERHILPLLQAARPHDARRDPEKRLRLGYVTADLYDHPLGRILLALLEAHDRAAFERFVYTSTPAADALTARARAACDHWREVGSLSDEAVAAAIRADGIDVLVDCSQHMVGNRQQIFARRPAPVQFAHLGYPSTTGNLAIDYRVSDTHIEPHDATLAGPERVARLPCSWWLFAPGGAGEVPALDVRPRPALAGGQVTFGSLNNPAKSSPEAIRQWAALLRAVPAARLALLTSRGGDRWVAEQLVAAGIAPHRIELLPQVPRERYLAYYHRLDIVIDPFPYTGHTTSFDAFWMGVPVLSRVGGAEHLPTSRAGASLAAAMDLPELAAANAEALIAAATALAGDLPRLATLSSSLRERLRASPLADAAAYTRHLEALYRSAWRTSCV